MTHKENVYAYNWCRRLNQRDIAKIAGVSSATVSRVINKDKKVSPKTAQKVLEVIKKNGYVQNAMARDLRMANTKTIGYLVPDINNPFFISMLSGFQEMCFKQGYDIIFENAADDPEKEKKALDTLLRYRVAGLLAVFVNTDNEYIHAFANMGIPVVMIDRKSSGPQTNDYLMIDNTGGVGQIVDYLVSLGHTDIAIIYGPEDITPGIERLQGFYQAMERNGVPVKKEFVVPGFFTEEGGYNAVKHLLKQKEWPTAMICANNLTSMGAYKALRDLKIGIPEQMSLVGFDDFPLAGHLQPPVTVLKRPNTSMGRKTAELLLERIGKGEEGRKIKPRNIVMPTKLCIRNSCAPIKK